MAGVDSAPNHHARDSRFASNSTTLQLLSLLDFAAFRLTRRRPDHASFVRKEVSDRSS
jgi:hypothetical protein